MKIIKTGLMVVIAVILTFTLVALHRAQKRTADLMAAAELTRQSVNNVSGISNPGTYPVIAPGEHEMKLGKRKYLLYIPKSYNPRKSTPLVMFYHGGGGWMEQAASDYEFEEKSEQAGFIAVFPNGSSGFPNQHLATWNAGNCCGYARDKKIDDVAFTRAVVADVKRRVNIDMGRIYATGMSNGGIMSHRLACDAADLFTAVAAVAGTDGMGDACHPSRPISVMHIHALDDDHVLFNGGAGPATRNMDLVADFTSVPDTIKLWVKRDGLNPTPKRVLQVPGAYADLYTATSTLIASSPTSKQNNIQVELVVTETGGHSWPGSPDIPNRDKYPSRAIKANDVIWNFFMTQVK